MNESQATSQLMAKMRERGYLVRKIQGNIYSPNMPDFYACRRGQTVFFEVKLFNGSLTRFTKFPVRPSPQLDSMLEHEEKGSALYLFLVKDGRNTFVWAESPIVVDQLARGSGPIIELDPRIPMSAYFKEVGLWMKEELPKIFKPPYIATTSTEGRVT